MLSALPEKITTEYTEGTEQTELDYVHVAEIQINGALDMFEQENYICAITLAGAANTLLKSLMADQEKRFGDKYEGALSALKKSLCEELDIKEQDMPNFSDPRNALKHYNEGLCDQEWPIKAWAIIELSCANLNLSALTKKPLSRALALINENSSVSSVVKADLSPRTDINHLSGEIIDCAIQAHKLLGPGLLESAYQQALAHILTSRKMPFSKEKPIPIHLDGLNIEAGYRADFIIDDKIILEIKSVDKLAPIHEAQMLTYMKLGKFPLGILLNFNEKLLKDGIKRMKL